MSTLRGIVITPTFEVHQDGGISIGGDIPAYDLRKYLLYWDKIDFIDNNIFSISGGIDIEFLQNCKIAKKTRVEFQSFSGDLKQSLLAAQHIGFQENERKEPGQWSMAQTSERAFLPDIAPTRCLEFELYGVLPVPKHDVPLTDIIAFKEKRRDELMALRIHLDELYEAIITSGDIPRAKIREMDRLESSIRELDTVMQEFRLPRVLGSLRGFIANDLLQSFGTGAGISEVLPSIPLSPLKMGMVGVGVAFALKMITAPVVQQTRQPLLYLQSVKSHFY